MVIISTSIILSTENKKRTPIETEPTTLYVQSNIWTRSVTLGPTEMAREIYVAPNLTLVSIPIYEYKQVEVTVGDSTFFEYQWVLIYTYTPTCTIRIKVKDKYGAEMDNRTFDISVNSPLTSANTYTIDCSMFTGTFAWYTIEYEYTSKNEFAPNGEHFSNNAINISADR